MEPLPTPRQFLNSLLSSLPLSSPQPSNQPSQPTPSPNPLKSLDQAHRNILITLHMLYPSLLLHSLDLLDRGLVTKISHISEPPSSETTIGQAAQESSSSPSQNQSDRPSKDAAENSFYLVHSAQTPTGNRSRQSNKSSSPKTYTVRLGAWNCSCAAFAFSSFPQVSSTTYDFSPPLEGDSHRMSLGVEGDVGGMSFDGMIQGDGKDGGVAMCKHLLACLLVERWGAVLGGYLEERRVGREEMAGLAADI